MSFYRPAISLVLLLNAAVALAIEIISLFSDASFKSAHFIVVALLITTAICYYALTNLKEILGERHERK